MSTDAVKASDTLKSYAQECAMGLAIHSEAVQATAALATLAKYSDLEQKHDAAAQTESYEASDAIFQRHADTLATFCEACLEKTPTLEMAQNARLALDYVGWYSDYLSEDD